MRSTLLPEIIFNFREVIEVVPAIHVVRHREAEDQKRTRTNSVTRLSAKAYLSQRFLRRDRLRRRSSRATIRRGPFSCLGGLILLPDKPQSRQRQKFIR